MVAVLLPLVVVVWLAPTPVRSLRCYVDAQADSFESSLGDACVRYEFTCAPDSVEASCTDEEKASGTIKLGYAFSAQADCSALTMEPDKYRDILCCTTNLCNPPPTMTTNTPPSTTTPTATPTATNVITGPTRNSAVNQPAKPDVAAFGLALLALLQPLL